MHVLALDIGTSSTRSAVFDPAGERVRQTTAQETYSLVTSGDGGAEIEPGALLRAAWNCLEKSVHAFRAEKSLASKPITGIGVSCFWHSLVGASSKGEALTRVITWADARCRADAAELRAELKEKEIHSRTGCMLRASFWPAKLRWLRRMDPRLFSRVTQWMSPAEWLQMQLAGGAHCALGMATGTGLFNPVKLAWDPELLKKCAVDPEQLRPLTDDPVPVSGRLASQFPELKGVPWFPAIGDGAAHNLGCGSTRPGFAAINVGTSAAIRVMRQGAKGDKTVGAPLGLFCYRVDDSRYLVGGAVSNAGNLRAWALRELRITDGPDLEAVLGERKEPKHGLAVLPFWTAERAPHWNEEDHGMIHGFTQHTTAVDILQALTEATYQRIALIAERLLEGEESAPKLIVGGGIQKSASSLQRLANVLGMPVYPNDEPEASLKGAAIFALERLGHPAPEHRLAASVRPQVKLSRMYEEQRERMKTLEEKMRAL